MRAAAGHAVSRIVGISDADNGDILFDIQGFSQRKILQTRKKYLQKMSRKRFLMKKLKKKTLIWMISSMMTKMMIQISVKRLRSRSLQRQRYRNVSRSLKVAEFRLIQDL